MCSELPTGIKSVWTYIEWLATDLPDTRTQRQCFQTRHTNLLSYPSETCWDSKFLWYIFNYYVTNSSIFPHFSSIFMQLTYSDCKYVQLGLFLQIRAFLFPIIYIFFYLPFKSFMYFMYIMYALKNIGWCYKNTNSSVQNSNVSHSCITIVSILS